MARLSAEPTPAATPDVVARALIEAENGRPEAIRPLLARAPTWHTPAANMTGGDHMGQEQVVRSLDEQRALTAGTFHVEPKGKLEIRGDTATLHVHAFGQRADRRLDLDADVSFRIKDGRVEELWTRPQDAQAWDRFWAP